MGKESASQLLIPEAAYDVGGLRFICFYQFEQGCNFRWFLIRSGISWSALLAAASKHEIALELMANLKAKDPKHSLAQGKVWKELGPICKEKGIARREHFETLDYYLREQIDEFQLAEPLNR